MNHLFTEYGFIYWGLKGLYLLDVCWSLTSYGSWRAGTNQKSLDFLKLKIDLMRTSNV
jgi:hypothetical protein